MRKITVLLILSILAAILITGCNYASAPSAEPSAETAVESSAHVKEQETSETANIENLAPVTEPADTSEPPVTEPQQGGEGASSPSMPPAQPENEPPARQEPAIEDELCGYPLAQPVTTSFEMYMQHYFENGSIIEIPQILDDSPTAEAINRELREIGDEYYKEYSDYIGTRRCEVIAYPCETEDYLCIVLVEREIPEDNNNGGEVESWIYDRKTQSQLMIDMAFDPDTIKAAMTPGMVFEEIEDIDTRITESGAMEHYITVEYSIDGIEYEGIFVQRDGLTYQYVHGVSMLPSYAVANFETPLWCRWEPEINNYMYDTTATPEEIEKYGEEIKTAAIKNLDLLLEAEDLKAVYMATTAEYLDQADVTQKCLAYQLVTLDEKNSYGIYYYILEDGGIYGPLTFPGGNYGRINQ